MLRLAIALTLFAAQTGAASAYGWPIRPFRHPHPLIGFFGDPRTVFSEDYAADGLNGPGKFSFHNGIDIAAPAGTVVYPVLSGRVHLLSRTALVVRASKRRVFQYFHLHPTAREGEWVKARLNGLGYVLGWARHLHFGEINCGRVVNPLAPGHLAPYTETRSPVVSGVEFRDPYGTELDPGSVHGPVDLIAAAYDTPSLVLAGATQAPPLSPAALSWSVTTPAGRMAVRTRTTVDFRRTLPFNWAFWKVYARGTYENNSTFGAHVRRAPGRYLFHLAPGLFETSLLPNGLYLLNVTATDMRGNSGSIGSRFEIANKPPLARAWAAGRVAAR